MRKFLILSEFGRPFRDALSPLVCSIKNIISTEELADKHSGYMQKLLDSGISHNALIAKNYSQYPVDIPKIMYAYAIDSDGYNWEKNFSLLDTVEQNYLSMLRPSIDQILNNKIHVHVNLPVELHKENFEDDDKIFNMYSMPSMFMYDHNTFKVKFKRRHRHDAIRFYDTLGESSFLEWDLSDYRIKNMPEDQLRNLTRDHSKLIAHNIIFNKRLVQVLNYDILFTRTPFPWSVCFPAQHSASHRRNRNINDPNFMSTGKARRTLYDLYLYKNLYIIQIENPKLLDTGISYFSFVMREITFEYLARRNLLVWI